MDSKPAEPEVRTCFTPWRRGTPIAVEINAALSIFLPSVELPQIEVARAKVVVHDIHEHADSSLVRGVHKFLQRLWSPIIRFHGE